MTPPLVHALRDLSGSEVLCGTDVRFVQATMEMGQVTCPPCAQVVARLQGRPPQPTEKAFLAQLVALARQHGWLVYHPFDSRGSAAGFPDLCMVRDVILFAELKSRDGKVTREQMVWLDVLRRTQRCEVYLWRPADWDAIIERLTAPRAPRGP